MALYDEVGNSISLGAKLGGGGEGDVFEVAQRPQWAAKIYHAPLSVEQSQKLRLMSKAGTTSLSKVAAWPISILVERAGGATKGILLPRVAKVREIHQVYSSIERRQAFPDADWSFLVHVGCNCAAAFEEIHAHGHVIGDVNQGGFSVADDATIRVIDCDSFQFRSDGRLFYCNVGTAHYTPPELQNVSAFHGVERTASHDCFGLALLIFHLLFMGRHPFAGSYSGIGDMPIEKAISESRFAFARHANSYQMAAPPNSLRLTDLPGNLIRLFDRAFAPPVNGFVARPTAQEWRIELGIAEKNLAICPSDRAHKYAQNLAACPWCRIEAGGGPAFFFTGTVTFEFDSTFKLEMIWSRIEQVACPLSYNASAALRPHYATPTPVPNACRYDLLGNIIDIPPEPILKLQDVPLVTPFEEEVIPADPEFRPISPPQLPDFDRLEDAIVSRLTPAQYGEYRLAFWGMVCSFTVSIALYQFPVGSMAAGVIGVTFAIGWLILAGPVRRERVRLRTERERLIRNRVTQHAELVKAIEDKNQLQKVECEQACAKLAMSRSTLAYRTAVRSAAWHEQVRHTRLEQIRITELNRRHSLEHLQTFHQWQQECGRIRHQNRIINDARNAWNQERRRRVARREELRADVENLRTAGVRIATDSRRDFDRELQELMAEKQSYARMKQAYEGDRDQLAKNVVESQVNDFLANHSIAAASPPIPNVGIRRQEILRNYGIVTAYDICYYIPDTLRGTGIGPSIWENLLHWRNSLESSFFRASHDPLIPQSQLRVLHRRYQAQKRAAQRRLAAGPEKLQAISNHAHLSIVEIQNAHARLLPLLAQAEADVVLILHHH